MIEYKTGDLLREDTEALVNTVNCVGVMGRGIALQFKKAFPENFTSYASACKQGSVQPGKVWVYDTGEMVNPRYIINFPTKRHWRGKSRMSDIEAGLNDLVEVIRRKSIKSIALPPLGCGLGGLDWNQVKSMIANALEPLEDVRIVVFEPRGAPAAKKMVRNRDVPTMTPGRAALVELMHRYLAGLLDPFVTLLEVHKLMYFMQEAGERLRLTYKQGIYGPYADNLRHVLHKIEGHFVSGYAAGGDEPHKQLNLVPGAIDEATAFLDQHRETKARFEKVTELVQGFESPFGLELLSTVHWVVTRMKADSAKDVVTLTHDWNDRKKQFTPRQISLALSVLTKQGWIDPLN